VARIRTDKTAISTTAITARRIPPFYSKIENRESKNREDHGSNIPGWSFADGHDLFLIVAGL
jgi:hypothetical protein